MIDRYDTLRRGLVGAWCPSLGATGLTIVDRSPYAEHAGLVSGATWSPLQGSLSLLGDGTSTAVRIRDRPHLRIAYGTICGWFTQASSVTGSRCIFASYSQNTAVAGITIGINIDQNPSSVGKLCVVVGRNAGTSLTTWGSWVSSATVTDGLPHHFACIVAPNGSVSFVVDGKQTTSTRTQGSTVSPVYATANYVSLGFQQSGPSTNISRYSGHLDDIRVYNRELTLSECLMLFAKRGNGLLPVRRRPRGVVPPAGTKQISVRVGGSWQPATPYVNVGGSWQIATPYTRQSGFWN